MNCLRALQVLGVKPVGPLGEVTKHLEELPSLLQLNKRRKPLGSGHAVAPAPYTAKAARTRALQGLLANAAPPRALLIGSQASPRKPAAAAASPRAQLLWGSRPSGAWVFLLPARHGREAAEAVTVDRERLGQSLRC